MTEYIKYPGLNKLPSHLKQATAFIKEFRAKMYGRGVVRMDQDNLPKNHSHPLTFYSIGFRSLFDTSPIADVTEGPLDHHLISLVYQAFYSEKVNSSAQAYITLYLFSLGRLKQSFLDLTEELANKHHGMITTTLQDVMYTFTLEEIMQLRGATKQALQLRFGLTQIVYREDVDEDYKIISFRK